MYTADMSESDTPHTRFIQCRLPSELYEWLRLRAFLSRKSMNSIVVVAAGEYRTAVQAKDVAPSRETIDTGSTVKYNVRVDDDLYEWLRTTAFYERLSINALLLAALIRYQQAHQNKNGDEKSLAM